MLEKEKKEQRLGEQRRYQAELKNDPAKRKQYETAKTKDALRKHNEQVLKHKSITQLKQNRGKERLRKRAQGRDKR